MFLNDGLVPRSFRLPCPCRGCRGTVAGCASLDGIVTVACTGGCSPFRLVQAVKPTEIDSNELTRSELNELVWILAELRNQRKRARLDFRSTLAQIDAVAFVSAEDLNVARAEVSRRHGVFLEPIPPLSFEL